MGNDFVKILEDFVEKNKTEEMPIDEITEEVDVTTRQEPNEVYDYYADIQKQFQEKEEEYNALKDKYIRQAAEFDNFRKRTLKEKEELRQSGHQKAVETILPIIDDFERALSNIAEESKEGVQLIYNKFLSTIQTLGVEPIVIEKNVTSFDTDIHDAITMVNVNDEELKGKIIDCVQTGYKLNGKIIRHPKVVVGEFNT
jgi:molecular chaperone GrpE